MRRIVVLSLLIVFFLGVFLRHLQSSEWISCRDTSEGRATLYYDGGVLNEWHFTYKGGRRYKAGLAVWASPALALVDGKPFAFIGGYDQTMHALDLVEKRQVWMKVTNAEIGAAPAVGKVDGIEVVFWGSSDRTVYACVAYNGRMRWTKELIPPSSTLGDVSLSSPLLNGGRLYITCFAYDKALSRNEQKGWLFCLDMRDGRVLWQVVVTNGFLSSPVGFYIDGRIHLLVAARRGLLHCFDVSGGVPKLLWAYQMAHEVLGSPVVEEGVENPLVFLGSKYGNLVAIDARTGKEKWQQMAGNFIDNSACIGEVGGEKVVFVGSHDYCVYAFRASDGMLLWKRALGGEVFSAPSFFYAKGKGFLVVASLDDHLYVLDASDGTIFTSYFTGQPLWDKVPKGEVLWGSPATVSAGDETVVVFGSFNDVVYVLPVFKECSMRAMARSSGSLWFGLLVVFVLFTGFLLPLVVRFIPCKE